MITTLQEGLVVVLKDGELIGFYRKDPKSHKNVLYMASEASMEEIEGLYRTELPIKSIIKIKPCVTKL